MKISFGHINPNLAEGTLSNYYLIPDSNLTINLSEINLILQLFHPITSYLYYYLGVYNNQPIS